MPTFKTYVKAEPVRIPQRVSPEPKDKLVRLARHALLILGFVACTAIPIATAQNVNFERSSDDGAIPVFTDIYDDAEFCADGKGDRPCDIAPVDVPEFDASFVYRFLAYHAQRPFDRFSWQAFTALMAPIDSSADTARWERFSTRRELFAKQSNPNPACRDDLPDGHLLLATDRQSTGDPLIDQAGNFVLFETRINPVAARYITENHLQTSAGRAAFAQSGRQIEFPIGQLAPSAIEVGEKQEMGIAPAAPGDMGAQLLKFAWRILPGNDVSNSKHYLVRSARISLSGDQALDGVAKCLDVTVGLVGMHLVQRVKSGNGDRWIWSSFEHIDNVPLAANARRPNSIITDAPFKEGCLAPGVQDKDFAFYGGHGQGGDRANQPISAQLKWADRPPYARTISGDQPTPPDIVRCWRLFSGTAESNFIWQRKLGGTVLAHYMLLGTQWIGNPGGAPFGIGEVPRFLTNSTLESFMQDQSDATCLGCHIRAMTDAGQNANFTFLFDPSH